MAARSFCFLTNRVVAHSHFQRKKFSTFLASYFLPMGGCRVFHKKAQHFSAQISTGTLYDLLALCIDFGKKAQTIYFLPMAEPY
jgi:hypothetical protein